MIALLLSVLGLVGVLPILGSIVGGSLGRSSLREIQASNGAMGGEEIAKWAVRLADLGAAIVLIIVAIAFYFFTIAPLLRQAGH